jgi:hypothetical protein
MKLAQQIDRAGLVVLGPILEARDEAAQRCGTRATDAALVVCKRRKSFRREEPDEVEIARGG